MFATIKTFLSNILFGKATQEDIASIHNRFRAKEAAEGKEKVHGNR